MGGDFVFPKRILCRGLVLVGAGREQQRFSVASTRLECFSPRIIAASMPNGQDMRLLAADALLP